MSEPVGLAHDYLLVMRGAERTFAEIARCWPEAPIYTTLYSSSGTGGAFAGREVRTSWLQRLGVGQRRFRALLPLLPGAVERLPVSGHGTLVSSSSAFALGIRPDPGALHVCYCHTPFRYAGHERQRALAEAPAALRRPLARLLDRIRRWEVAAAERVSAFVANSVLTRERIAAAYGREAEVVHPPVELGRFAPGEPGGAFLCVSELVAHKRVDLALEAARLAGVRIDVVGTGPEERRLRARYTGTATFHGRVGDEELARMYSRARAVVVPSIEEFGIVAVEAQASGRPVVAPARGGALESVIDGETGVLVPEGDRGAFASALREVDFDSFSPRAARASAERFAPEIFRSRLIAAVERARAG